MIYESGSIRRLGSTLYGVCSTAANTAAKTVTISDFDTLIEGITVHVRFTNFNSAANPTLNVSGTGAYPIYYSSSVTPTDAITWKAGEVVSLTFDGTGFGINGGAVSGSGSIDLTPLTNRVSALETGKVDKVTGKSLSTNDYDATEKDKVANAFVGISTSGSTVTVTKNDGTTASATVTPPAFTGATAQANGTAGLVPAPQIADHESFLRGDGTWAAIESGAVYTDATQSVHGLMSTTDKIKLDGFGESSTYALASELITTDATTSVHGLMSTADKTKLESFTQGSDYVKKNDVASTFYGGVAYSEGGYVYEGGVLYRAIQDIPSSETTFVTAHWARAYLGNELSMILELIADLDERIVALENPTS